MAEAVGLDGDALFHHPAVMPGAAVVLQKLGHCILEGQSARGPSLLGGPPAGQKLLRSQSQILGDLGAVIQRRTKLGHQRLVHIKNHGLNGHGRFLRVDGCGVAADANNEREAARASLSLPIDADSSPDITY